MRCHPAAKANRILQHSFRPVSKLSGSFLPHRNVQTSTAASTSSQQQIIFSGIQPTGIPHLGNYLGALREWVRLQNESTGDRKLLFSVVDLHALTVPQEASQLRQWRREIYAVLLAIGLDPKRSTIFFQSAVRISLDAVVAWGVLCDYVFLTHKYRFRRMQS
jgi:tryptophanyl-tRNA synthetase